MTEDEFRGFRAEMFGMFHAIQVSIQAFAQAHPDPDALVRAFAEEHESSMSTLLASPYPDLALEAYKSFLRGCAPNQSDWLEA
jgi:hypothetical protein